MAVELLRRSKSVGRFVPGCRDTICIRNRLSNFALNCVNARICGLGNSFQIDVRLVLIVFTSLLALSM